MTALVLAAALASAPIGQDKAFHFTAGLAAGAGSHTLSSAYLPDTHPVVVSLSSVILMAVGKEALDAMGAGTPDARDAAWTVLGGVVGIGISLGVQALFGSTYDKTR